MNSLFTYNVYGHLDRDCSKIFLKTLPTIYEFSTPQGLALLCHGLGKNDLARLTLDDYGSAMEVNYDLQKLIQKRKYKYIINGHTHQLY